MDQGQRDASPESSTPDAPAADQAQPLNDCEMEDTSAPDQAPSSAPSSTALLPSSQSTGNKDHLSQRQSLNRLIEVDYSDALRVESILEPGDQLDTSSSSSSGLDVTRSLPPPLIPLHSTPNRPQRGSDLSLQSLTSPQASLDVSLDASHVPLESQIARSLAEITTITRSIRQDADGHWDDPNMKIRAMEIKCDAARDLNNTTSHAIQYVNMMRGLDRGTNSPMPPGSFSIAPDLTAGSHSAGPNLTDTLREVYTPLSKSKYTVSISINEDVDVNRTVRQIFLDAMRGSKSSTPVTVVAQQNHLSHRNYLAIVKTKEMVATALEALNNYQLDGKPLKTIASIGTETASSYSIRTARIPHAAIACLINNKQLDQAKAKMLIQSENRGWFRTVDDIESIQFWKAKSEIPTDTPFYCLKLYISISSFMRFLEQPDEYTTIERGEDIYKIYEDLPMPQCLNCHWVGHKSDTCNFGTYCRICGEEHSSNQCTKVNRDARNRTQPLNEIIDHSVVKCHRCAENNKIYHEAPPHRKPKVPYFPRWTPCPENHPATLPTCPSLLQNKDWLRLYTKTKCANKLQVDLYKAPPPPQGPFPWHKKEIFDPQNRWEEMQV